MKNTVKEKERLRNELAEKRQHGTESEASWPKNRLTEKGTWKSRGFFETIIEGNMDGIIITDGKGVIISVNGAMERMTFFTKEELIGKNFSDLFAKDKDIRKKVSEKIKELFEKGLCSYESKFITKDGNLIDV